MFAALAVLSFAFVWWLAPETKGRPLEAIRAYWENGGRWPEGDGARRRRARRAVHPRGRDGAGGRLADHTRTG